MRSRVDLAALCLLAGCSLVGYEEREPGDELDPDTGTTPVNDAGGDPTPDAELDARSDTDDLDAALDADAQLAEDAQPVVDAESEDASALDAQVVDAAMNDSGRDAGPDAGLDAGLPPSTVIDAGDTGEAGVPWDAGTATCAGTRALNLCWYLAPSSTSCNTFCASHGGFDGRAIATVGGRAQGGSAANCRAVLNALGLPGNVTAGTRSDGRGFGCHQWQQPLQLWWLTQPGYSASASAAQIRPACACTK